MPTVDHKLDPPEHPLRKPGITYRAKGRRMTGVTGRNKEPELKVREQSGANEIRP